MTDEINIEADQIISQDFNCNEVNFCSEFTTNLCALVHCIILKIIIHYRYIYCGQI